VLSLKPRIIGGILVKPEAKKTDISSAAAYVSGKTLRMESDFDSKTKPAGFTYDTSPEIASANAGEKD
jgi:hypothetical protein